MAMAFRCQVSSLVVEAEEEDIEVIYGDDDDLDDMKDGEVGHFSAPHQLHPWKTVVSSLPLDPGGHLHPGESHGDQDDCEPPLRLGKTLSLITHHFWSQLGFVIGYA